MPPVEFGYILDWLPLGGNLMRIPALSGGLATVLICWASLVAPSQAQYAPRCLLNGVRIFCAITSFGRAEGTWQKTTVVTADDRRIDLQVNESTCRKEGDDKFCLARITMRDSRGSGSSQGFYQLHRSEAGVSHRYLAGALVLTYYFMD
jgi:hypothetical protein